MENDKDIDIAAIQLPDTFVQVTDHHEITDIPIQRPRKDTWWMVHPDESWKVDKIASIDHEMEVYVTTPEIVKQLGTRKRKVDVVSLHAAIDHNGEVFLLPTKVFDASKQAASLRSAVTEARFNWVKIAWNKSSFRYDKFNPEGEIDPPVWPDGADPLPRTPDRASRLGESGTWQRSETSTPRSSSETRFG